jgi:hypothetical protein
MSSPQLGPFRLTAITHRSQAGVVYSAVDSSGRQVSVAVLTRGAASDAAARDRFAAAIRADAGSLLAADPDNSGPWAAGPGAARLLESVQLADAGRAAGPGFQHHWAGWDDPAFPSYGAQAPSSGSDPYPTWDSAGRSVDGGPGSFVTWGSGSGSAGRMSPASGLGQRQTRPSGWIAVIILILLFLLVALLLWWLYTSQPDPDKRPPPTPTPTSVSPSPSPSASPSSGSPTPSPSGSSSPTRTPGSTGPSGATPGQSGTGEPDDPL